MNRTMSAILLGLLMVMMPLAGCVSDGTDGLQGPEGPPGEDGSSLHLVVAESELPECNGDLQGQIYFVSSDGAFQVCSTMGWSVVDLTGPAGADGTNGTDGQDGSPGENGADGTNGTDGTDGSPGANGADGTDGANGKNATNGTDGLSALAVTTNLGTGGPNCPDGGVQMDVGVDDNGNGVLEASERDQTTYICNGADGSDGADSASPTGSSAWGINFSNNLDQRWGSGSSTLDSNQSFIFTTAFTSGCSGVFIQRNTAGSTEILPVTTCTQTGFTIDRNNDINGAHNFWYFAVGY